MKTMKPALMFATLTGLTLCVALTARMTSAQRPGPPRPNTQGRNPQARNSQPSGGGGRGGGQGRFGGQMPFAAGRITGGDASTGRLTIQSQNGGNPQTIQVNNATRMVTQTPVSVSNLQVNDQVQVQGIPTGITADSITAGQMPDFESGGSSPQPGGGNRGNGAGNGNRDNAGMGFASATGRITALNPLTISVGNGVSLSVNLASNARVTRITPTSFNSLKVGDHVMATGQMGETGTINATGIAVNMDRGGREPGGF